MTKWFAHAGNRFCSTFSPSGSLPFLSIKVKAYLLPDFCGHTLGLCTDALRVGPRPKPFPQAEQQCLGMNRSP